MPIDRVSSCVTPGIELVEKCPGSAIFHAQRVRVESRVGQEHQAAEAAGGAVRQSAPPGPARPPRGQPAAAAPSAASPAGPARPGSSWMQTCSGSPWWGRWADRRSAIRADVTVWAQAKFVAISRVLLDWIRPMKCQTASRPAAAIFGNASCR